MRTHWFVRHKRTVEKVFGVHAAIKQRIAVVEVGARRLRPATLVAVVSAIGHVVLTQVVAHRVCVDSAMVLGEALVMLFAERRPEGTVVLVQIVNLPQDTRG